MIAPGSEERDEQRWVQAEGWAGNGWRDPVGDRPANNDEVLVLIDYENGDQHVQLGWLGESPYKRENEDFGNPHWQCDCEIDVHGMPIESGCRVVGWQPKPAACRTPASGKAWPPT